MSSPGMEVEAGSLEEARQKLQNQIPEGFTVLSEQVLADGMPQTLRSSAETAQLAWEKALQLVPHGAEVLSKQELIPSGRRVVQVEAFTEQEAKNKLGGQLEEASILHNINTMLPPRKGLMGLGKTAGLYEAEIIQHCVVEITYKTNAKIKTIFEHAIIIEAEQLRGVKNLKGLDHLKGEIQLTTFLHRVADGSVEQFKLIPESTLGELIGNAQLGSPSYGDVSKSLVARLLEINCRNSKLWSCLFESCYGSSDHLTNLWIQTGIPALEFMLWYLNTPEAATNLWVRAAAQNWFLTLVGRHYSECDPVLQEQIIMIIKEMIQKWESPYLYTLPACCRFLAATGRKDMVQVIMVGIQRCDGKYTAALNSNVKDDGPYTDSYLQEMQEWEDFKQSIHKALIANT